MGFSFLMEDTMIALYCRVSTDEQREHGFSIDNQKERLENIKSKNVS